MFLHQYTSPTKGLFQYKSGQFGDMKGQLILAQLNDEKVHIWYRDTSDLIHSFPMDRGREILDVSLMWNSTDPQDIKVAIMARIFSGRHTNTLQMWTIIPPEDYVSDY
ncbi:hypothetical protein FRC03_007152 [Tulasnella sp. 419]|nr:hypothetical protein FRC03_007152 [Tulasnella sp. 419]